MKKTPPPPGPVRNIAYPPVALRELSNGLKVLVVEDFHLPRVSAQLAFPAGRADSPSEHRGLTDLAVEMLKEGTRKRTALEIADAMDRCAIDYRAETYMEYSLLEVTMLAKFLTPGLELLGELAQQPAFPQAELEKIKVRWRSHLAAQRSDPAFLAGERAYQQLFPGHPYSRISIPLEHLEKTESQALEDFYRRNFACRGAYLLLAGAVEPETAFRVASEVFGEWTAVERPAAQSIAPAASTERSICLVDRPHSVQSHVVVATRTVARAHPDVISLKVMNQVFGGGASSRLFLNLREEKGYTYGAYSTLRSYQFDGALMSGASVRTEVTAETLDLIFDEMERMISHPVEPEELKRSQSELIGSFVRRMETADSIASLELVRRLYDLPEDYFATYIPDIRAVDSSEVCRMAEQFLQSEKSVITVVADRAAVDEELRKRGRLSVYDTEGNLLEAD